MVVVNLEDVIFSIFAEHSDEDLIETVIKVFEDLDILEDLRDVIVKKIGATYKDDDENEDDLVEGNTCWDDD